jgi:hypothetical protein
MRIRRFMSPMLSVFAALLTLTVLAPSAAADECFDNCVDADLECLNQSPPYPTEQCNCLFEECVAGCQDTPPPSCD